MPDEKPLYQRPELPDFWDHRFRNGTTPWETGGAPAGLREFAARYELSAGTPPPRTLIPGCGSAHDAALLDARGWRVTALDFSPAAVEAARQTLSGAWRGELRCADFFTFDAGGSYDLVYERAFLCALPRTLRTAYADRVAALLGAGGLLAGYFFISEEPKGPPFGIATEELERLLTPCFTRTEDRPVNDSLPVFSGRERWQVWVRR